MNADEILNKHDKVHLSKCLVNDVFWDDDKVVEFVNWYMELHNLGFRYMLENRSIIESFKRGDDASVWHCKMIDTITEPPFYQTRVIRIPILDFYAGGYRLEYDGKYITLFGRDKNHKGFKFDNTDKDWFEEMVLIPVVEEIRNASPEIIEVSNTEIVIDLGCV